ncbi:MAG: restriction endonuclease subunit S [Candidatus Muiribacteriota bacterium]
MSIKLPLKTFDEVLEIRSGRNQKEVLDTNGEYPIIGSAGKIMGYANSYICEENTTIIGRKGTINSPMIINEKFWNVDTAFGLHAKEELDKKYLFYFCQNFDFTKLDRGSGRPSLVKSDLLKIKIPIPPIEKQKQIVAVLDKAFDAIDSAKQNLQKNLDNAQDLFQSRLNEIFSQKGEGWEEKTLGEVCKTAAGGTPLKSKKEYYENGTIPWLCSGEVKQGNIYSSANYITQQGLDNSSAKIFPINTVVVAMYGATAGDVGMLKLQTSTNQAVCGIFPSKLLLPKFIYYAFTFKKSNLIAQAIGNAQPNISQSKIKNTLIPLISKDKQKQIVKELDRLKEQTKQLEKYYEQKLKNLDELKKSVLQKAFSGELV